MNKSGSKFMAVCSGSMPPIERAEMGNEMDQRIKVLLVDDEVLALEFLEGLIPWQELGYEVVGKVTNGKKALAVYRERNPQIVISDIKMAVMDGLELSKQIREMSEQTKIILLSAYRDFEYAKKGIQYGVNNYLLKHELSSEKLQAELTEIRESLEKENARHNIIREHFIKSLIFNLRDEKSEEYIKSIGSQFCFLMVQKNTSYFSKYGKPEDVEDLKEMVREAEVLSNEGLGYVTDIPILENNYLILYKWERVNSDKERQEYLAGLMKAFLTPLQREERKQFTLIAAREVPSHEIAAYFQRLSRAVRYHIFMTGQEYYFLQDLPIGEVDENLDFKKEKEALELCMKEGREEGETVIGKIFGRIRQPQWNLSACNQMTVFLNFYLEDAAQQQQDEAQQMDAVQSIEESQQAETAKPSVLSRNAVCNIEDLERYYRSAYQKLTAGSSYCAVIQEVIRHIRRNYAQELTLEGLGTAIGMNGVYLGQMFKKEVGTTFLKYVTDYRMQMAKEMLRSGQYNVAEAAEAVGYRTGQYFSQIFMKYAGCTPQTYKKMGEKGAKKEL